MMKNIALRSFVRASNLFFFAKKEKKSPKNLLIVSTTGLGDSLWGTPAIKALKKSALNPHISLLTSPAGALVFKENPHVDKLFVLKNTSLKSYLKILKPLIENNIHTVYLFHTSQRLVLPFINLLRPEKIVGTLGINKGLDDLLTHPVEKKGVHEIERRLHLVGQKEALPEMEIFLRKKERKEAALFLKDQNIDSSRPLIGIHPGAKNRFKQWSPKHFIALGKRLALEKKAKILISGDKNEAFLAKTIAKEIPESLSIAGKFSLHFFGALIEKMDHFVTGDTGPMHMAFALKTPTTALFSPTDPNICGPYHIEKAQVIAKEKTCFPCINKKCRSPFCLQQITPSEVFNEVAISLGNSNTHRAPYKELAVK